MFTLTREPDPTVTTAMPGETFLATVVDRRERADGVVSFQLALPPEVDGTWAPGSHIDVHLPNQLTRQYSLCGDPDQTRRWQIAVLNEPEGRGGSRYLHERVEAGAQLSVSKPRNHFELALAHEYIFVAGGIGITPILPMLQVAERAGANWKLHYGGRTLESMAFRDELSQYGDKVQLYPLDEVGLIPLARIIEATETTSLIYTCGPESLLNAVNLATASWPEDSIRMERFSARPVSENVNSAFTVHLAVTGQSVHVAPDESIVQALEKVGVFVPTSCREGTCGSCETAVLAGVPEHRDSILSDSERAQNDTMMVCVGRSKSESLTLDR